MKPTKRNISLFRISSILGLTFCFILNILMCFFILKIIPQKINPIDRFIPSLELAELRGQSANIAVVEYILLVSNKNIWLAYLLNIFGVTSVSVSFIVILI
jgi:hypothetical protein